MSFCVHGLHQENCPHCRVSNGIKPPTRLVKLAPREIPMPIPRKDQFLHRNEDQFQPPHVPSQSISPFLKNPVRDFNLREKLFRSEPSIFSEKREDLVQKHSKSEELHEKDVKIKLQDIEQNFIQK